MEWSYWQHFCPVKIADSKAVGRKGSPSTPGAWPTHHHQPGSKASSHCTQGCTRSPFLCSDSLLRGAIFGTQGCTRSPFLCSESLLRHASLRAHSCRKVAAFMLRVTAQRRQCWCSELHEVTHVRDHTEVVACGYGFVALSRHQHGLPASSAGSFCLCQHICSVEHIVRTRLSACSLNTIEHAKALIHAGTHRS
eukprot:1157249-Pelagomonas_calceolata.AAC.14